MNVRIHLLVTTPLSSLPPPPKDGAKHALEPADDLFTVVKRSVGDGACIECEEGGVDE